MLTLSSNAVKLARVAPDWRDALRQAGTALADDGLVESGYADALFDREAQGSTYLGAGIAIPHGTPQSREHVRETGVRVLQFPAGVEWHDGERVFLLIAIAARSDEHLEILRALTHVLDRDGIGERLAAAADADELVELLGGEQSEARLDSSTIVTGVPAASRLELAAAAAGRLYAAGCVSAEFITAALVEPPVSLGQKLWLIRGKRGVLTPALGFASAAAAVEDCIGVFCLAEREREHVPLMERLITLLEEGNGEALARVGAEQILARLAGQSSAAEIGKVRVRNDHGLHARPAKQLVQVARQQPVPVSVRLSDGGAPAVPASSLTKVINLGARRGQMLIFSAEGEGAKAAVEAMVEAVRGGLGEVVAPLADTTEARPSRNHTHARRAVPPPETDVPHAAVSASPGLAVAEAFVVRPPEFRYPERFDDQSSAEGEQQRLRGAITTSGEQLRELILRAPDGGEVSEILSMHEEILFDEELERAAVESITEGASAEAGWWKAIDASARAQEQLADRLLAERAMDLRDVGRRVLASLCGVSLPPAPDDPYVLVMDDAGPSDVARLDTSRVKGLLTAKGGATSHSAILARALGIPAVVGAGEQVLAIPQGSELIVDGDRGRWVVGPCAERRTRTLLALKEQELRRRKAFDVRFEPALTRDGHRVEVAANLGSTAHAHDAVEHGAEAVGLLRTEFVFMAHSEAPDLDTQISEYRRAFDALGPERALVARTLDVGGDKPLSYWPLPHEENPFLGLRGIRLALTRPEVLETQIRALLVASQGRPLRIMLPMVKDVLEFRAARAIVDRVIAELGDPILDLQLGVMVEVPSCALLAETLAEEVDFFSIGTNDLTQYTLAIDRGHSLLSAQADGLHPAVLRLIRTTVAAAHARGRWVGVCGELAADPQAVPVLVGLGVDELSVSVRQVPMVKARVRELELSAARALAEQALALGDAGAVRDLVERS
ncbi:phosphoenolpyruvate--protein phosphotransferase [Halotalea alkalilenta]|uniref:phosphoenolpyruvate--protein phosphotransferase n=1 Tax=Halotalea alkalilenta TaxID=376489 RepID=A0A172YDQ2_9GAMM|nr:phosphoenolpyruvate--protein phosphotransferase [Halotalea alkalilenta]ANF57105.1 PTS fructose transporter subunit IIA [Halotalea alkalilenta]